MKAKERIQKYFRTRSPFRITTDLLFYLLILSLLLPFSRKYVATGMNKLIMHRPAIIKEASQVTMADGDYDWMLADLDGTPVSFSEFEGRLVFLSFWATWCPPCRAEMPNIQWLYEQYGDRISFVLVSQEPSETIRRYLEEHGFTVTVYRLVENPPSKLSTSTIPTTYLITHKGKIAVRKTGAARWDGKFFTSYLDRIVDRSPSSDSIPCWLSIGGYWPRISSKNGVDPSSTHFAAYRYIAADQVCQSCPHGFPS